MRGVDFSTHCAPDEAGFEKRQSPNPIVGLDKSTMAKRAGRAAPGRTATASTPAGELRRHLAALGLESAHAYRAWCRSHGFGPAVNKSWHERRVELLRAERLHAEKSA